VRLVYDYLRGIDADPIELTLDEIKERLGLNIRSEGISACEKLLEGVKALERLDSRQNMAGVKIDSQLPTLVDLLPREAKVQRRVLQVVERLVGELRGERVYISPRQIAKEAEVEVEAASRALRELAKLQSFDYVPPFRGRAVHMLERKKPFEKLGIDFAEQQRRKAAEYAKLDRMIAYATSRRCRQLDILDYFGDPAKATCGLCDHCSGVRPLTAGENSGEEANSPQVMQAMKMVLAGVARMCQRGQYGKRLLAGMLVGSTSVKVTRLGLDRLSTYGLLRHLTEVEATELIDAILRQRLLQQLEVERFKPVVQLTPRGEQVMKGEVTLSEPLAISEGLSRKLGGVAGKPPRKAAQKATESRTIAPSAGTTTVDADDDDADPFAEVNAEFVDPSPPRVNHVAHPAANHASGPHYWTWRVLSAGFSADECRQIRGLDADTLFDHVLRAGREGQPIDAAWLLTSKQLGQLAAVLDDATPARLRSLLENLPAGMKYRDVQLYLLSRGLSAMP
jgi:ATP-dependent DNA helicase RecQ